MANNLAAYVASSIVIGSAVGSGTVGSALFVGTGSLLAQDNANFYWDVTNSRLAIGTTTFSNAAVKLQVSSGSDVRFVLEDTANGNASFWLRTNAVDRFVFNSNSSATDATTLTAVPFRLGTNNTVALTIDGSQNVGIGTQTPLAGTHLEVLGTSTAGRDVLIRGTGTDIGYSVNNTGTSGREYALISSNSGSVVGTGTFSIYDLTAGSTRLQISSAGLVSIGPATTGNSAGQRHVINGALYAGNVTATDASGELVISNNARVGTANAEDGRTNTTTGGSAIILNNRTADASNAMTFNVNAAGAATNVTATTAGIISQSGFWTLGTGASKTTSATAYHTMNYATYSNVDGASGATTGPRINFISANYAPMPNGSSTYALVSSFGYVYNRLGAPQAGSDLIWQLASTTTSQTAGSLITGTETIAGTVSAAGTWSFGGSTGSLTHGFNSGSTTTVSIFSGAAAGDATLQLQAQGVNTGYLSYSRSLSRLIASNQTAGSGPYVAVNGTSWTTGTSDERLKKNITVISNCLGMLLQVRPITYQLIADGVNAKVRAGVVAQDLLAAGYSWPVDVSDPSHYALTPDEMSALYIGAIQELKAQFDAYVLAHP